MIDKLTQTGSQASLELSRSICQEQIIIDGVDVSKCSGYIFDIAGKQNCIALACNSTAICEKSPNCYFKQLARKTQECGELKENLNNSEKWRIKAEGLNEKLDLKYTCYRKALEEIEEYIQIQLDGFGNDVYAMQKCAINHIQNIINKARKEES